MKVPTSVDIIVLVGDLLATKPASKFTIKNWLTQVRGPLQWLMNNGHLHRIADVHTERYALGKGA